MDPRLTLHQETIEIDGGRTLTSYTFTEGDGAAGNLTDAPEVGGEESL